MISIYPKMNLVFRNLGEAAIDGDTLRAKIEAGQQLIGYIGFAPTGQIHLGYLVPCMKIRDLTLAGCNMAIMIADMHSLLDERKTPLELVDVRSKYYELMLTKILSVLGADLTRVKFVRGSSFQQKPQYFMDVLDLASKVTVNAAKKAGTDVVKQTKDPKLGSSIYPVMQAVDENHVGQATFGVQVDFELGGVDQRKIFCFSKDQGNSKIAYLMNPIISLNKTGKMSASDANGKIVFTDTDETITNKVKKAFCLDGDVDCGIMKLMQGVFFALHDTIEVNSDTGPKTYVSYETFEQDFKTGVFISIHLKECLNKFICELVNPLRAYLDTQEMKDLVQLAYN